MKTCIKRFLQWVLGFETYLFLFACFKILTLKYDKKENDFFVFLNRLPEEGIVLDIGANLGAMTYHLSKKVKRGKIFAYEPVDINFRILRRICTSFKLSNVCIQESALGENAGELEMVMPVLDKVKMHGLSYVKKKNIKDFPGGIHFHVEVKKLDDIYPEIKKSGTIKGIKLDAENYEYLILKGGLTLIAAEKPLIYCELWDNRNRFDCFELMKSYGYSVWVNFRGKLVPFNSEKHQTQNFFFIFQGIKEQVKM